MGGSFVSGLSLDLLQDVRWSALLAQIPVIATIIGGSMMGTPCVRCAIQTSPCASETRIFNAAIPGTESCRHACCRANPAAMAHKACGSGASAVGQAAVTASPENCRICPPAA
jgi:hypothetical protein